MSMMNVLSATLIALILGAGVALYFGMSAAAAAGNSTPTSELLAMA